MPKFRRILAPPANAPRWNLESFKLSQWLEMLRDIAQEVLKRLHTQHKTEWENFMALPGPDPSLQIGNASQDYECA